MNFIIEIIKDPKFDVELALEALVSIGHCVLLVYDDNGHWALTQPVLSRIIADDDAPFELWSITDASSFKPTIREAIVHYVEGNIS